MKKSLAFWPLVATMLCLVSGGPFGLEPLVQSGAGVAVALVLITPVVWSLPAALMTAELSSALPDEGGYYVWVRRSMGPFGAFLCGWWSWIYSWIDVAIYPVLFVAYLDRLLALFGRGAGLSDQPWLSWGVGMVLIVAMTLVNIRGTRLVGESSIVFFILILAPFAALVLLGVRAWVAGAPHIPPVAPGHSAISAASSGLFVVMWNYLGWDSMSTVAGEVEHPKRAYPRALGICVPVVTLVYLLPLLAGLPFLPALADWKEGAWVAAARVAGGPVLAAGISIAGLISAAALFSSTLLAGSRIPFVIAEDRVLPAALTRLHSRYGTPWIAILVSAAFFSILSFASFKELASADVIVYSAGLLLEFSALVILRLREPKLERPYRIPGGWPVIAIVVALPVVILSFAIREQITGDHAVAIRWFTAIALLSGPVVWWVSRLFRSAGRA